MTCSRATLASLRSGIALVGVILGITTLAIFRLLRPGEEGTDSQRSKDSNTDMQKPPRPITKSELSGAVGGPGKDLYIAVKDPYNSKIDVFDVSSGDDFYGPGGPYHIFVGKNASHGLACSSTDPAKVTGDLSTLTAHQKDTHMQWHAKYLSKYPVVGFLVDDDAAGSETSSIVTEEAKKDE